MFWMIGTSGTTPEGLCFEAVMKSIINDSKGKDSYFINYSDGMPMFGNQDIDYYYEGALTHTASQVDNLRRNGVKVLSYFIADGNYNRDKEERDFKKMYGSDAQYINVENVTAIARTINKKMLAK
jgi:hypothetical protein